jgi:hypothetical protein
VKNQKLSLLRVRKVAYATGSVRIFVKSEKKGRLSEKEYYVDGERVKDVRRAK